MVYLHKSSTYSMMSLKYKIPFERILPDSHHLGKNIFCLKKTLNPFLILQFRFDSGIRGVARDMG